MTTDSRLKTTARRALVCLDLTNLEDGCDAAAIEDLCRRAQTPHGSVAAVCIWPRFVAQAARALERTGIKVATVVNFPGGDQPLDEVLAMTRTALGDGADEIDLVVPWRRLKSGDEGAVTDCVRAVKEACGEAVLKAILETGELADPALIGIAAERALDGGADFLKTSTGKVKVNATPRAAEILLKAIERRGSRAGFKAAGGVRTIDDAALYLDIADRIMGSGWAGPRHFRFGASGLLAALIATLDDGKAPKPSPGY
jgi:deoxyribose-phosphate aldolase